MRAPRLGGPGDDLANATQFRGIERLAQTWLQSLPTKRDPQQTQPARGEIFDGSLVWVVIVPAVNVRG